MIYLIYYVNHKDLQGYAAGPKELTEYLEPRLREVAQYEYQDVRYPYYEIVPVREVTP